MAATTRRGYKPLTVDDAEELVNKVCPDESGHFSSAEVMIMAELIRLHQRIDDIENKADEMMSPDKMMEMAGKFLGGGL